MARLGEVAFINPRGLRLDDERRISFLGMADVSEEGFTGVGTTRPFADVKKGYTSFLDKDLLVAKITPCFENGKIAQATLAHPHGYGSTEFHVVRPRLESADARYVLHFLRSPRVRVEGERRMTGSAGQRRVPTDYFATLEIPLPSLAEQRRIAAILDQADELRTKRRRTLVLLDELASAAFESIFETRSSKTRTVSIRSLLDSTQYGTSAKAGIDGEFAVLRMGNITRAGRLDLADIKYIDIPERDRPKYLVRRGDVLFNRTNSAELVGKTALYDDKEPRAFAGYLVRLRPSEPDLGPFISGFLNSAYGKAKLRSMAKSIVGMANINAREVGAMSIPISSAVQRARFAEIRRVIEDHRLKQEGALRELDTLFASLQHRAFRGEL